MFFKTGSTDVLEDRYPHISKCNDIMIEPTSLGLPKGIKRYDNASLLSFDLNKPKSKQVEWCSKNSYLIIPGPPRPLSVIEIHQVAKYFFCTTRNPWFASEDRVNNDRVESRWYIVRDGVLENSESRPMIDQMSLMRPKERLLNVAEVAWLEVISKINFKRFLLPSFSTRTSTVFMRDRNISVGGSKMSGISVSNSHDNNKSCRTIALQTQIIF